MALIRWGTTEAQETLIGSLADIAEKAQAAGLEPPVVAVIGDVVTLRDQLRWFDDLSVVGMRKLTFPLSGERKGSLALRFTTLPEGSVSSDDCSAGSLQESMQGKADKDLLRCTSG